MKRHYLFMFYKTEIEFSDATAGLCYLHIILSERNLIPRRFKLGISFLK